MLEPLLAAGRGLVVLERSAWLDFSLAESVAVSLLAQLVGWVVDCLAQNVNIRNEIAHFCKAVLV